MSGYRASILNLSPSQESKPRQKWSHGPFIMSHYFVCGSTGGGKGGKNVIDDEKGSCTGIYWHHLVNILIMTLWRRWSNILPLLWTQYTKLCHWCAINASSKLKYRQCSFISIFCGYSSKLYTVYSFYFNNGRDTDKTTYLFYIKNLQILTAVLPIDRESKITLFGNEGGLNLICQNFILNPYSVS